MDANQYIDEMIDTITERGWCQDELEADDGSVCILGAFEKVHRAHYTWMAGKENWENDLAVSNAAYEAKCRIQDRIVNGLGYVASIPHYNDHVAKSAEDVILLLKRSKAE